MQEDPLLECRRRNAELADEVRRLKVLLAANGSVEDAPARRTGKTDEMGDYLASLPRADREYMVRKLGRGK